MYDHQGRLIERIDNGETTDFVYLGSTPVARIENGQTTYIHPDYQNTPILETDPNGNITRSPVYLAYGFTVQDGSYKGLDRAPGYVGSYPEIETGLNYMGARYQFGAIGRFLSADPVGLNPLSPTGLNRYVYAAANPTRFTDPTGRAPQDSWYGLNDRGFRDWVHAEKQSQGRGGAQNYTKSELKNLHEEWKALGKPRGKGGTSGRGGNVRRQRGFIAPGLFFKANAILYLITYSESLNAGELEALEMLRQEAADPQKQKSREEPKVRNSDKPPPPPPAPKKAQKEENKLDQFHFRQF